MLNVRKQKEIKEEEPEGVEYNAFNGYQRQVCRDQAFANKRH